jgi:hypothetical protein
MSYFVKGSARQKIHQAGLPENITATINYRRVDDGSFYLSLIPDAEEVLKEEGIIS